MIAHLFKGIFLFGVNPKLSRDVNRAIIIANQIALFGSVVCLVMFFFQVSSFGWHYEAISTVAIGLVFLVPLMANYLGWTLFSRIFISIHFPTSTLLASLVSKLADTPLYSNWGASYYTYRFFIMLSGVAAMAVYDHRHRKWSYFLVLYVTFVLLLFDPLHNYFGVGYYQTGHRDESYYVMNIIVLLAFTGQMIGLYILRFSIEKNEMDLLREIEERKKVEVEIRHAKNLAEVANEAKSEFLANVSHEIRTPLNGVIGFSDLLIKTPLNDSQLKYMSVLNRSAHSLLDIVNAILDHSKIEAGKIELEIEKTNIYDLCAQVIEAMRYQSQQKNQRLTLSIAKEIPAYIYIDATRLRQILINLLGNAIKFTEQGEVELIVKQAGIISDTVTLQFSVRDTGLGIDPKDQGKIFEAFAQGDISSTKKFGGTGLGLTISNSLLALMGSKLELTSEVHKGSTFSFRLVIKAAL